MDRSLLHVAIAILLVAALPAAAAPQSLTDPAVGFALGAPDVAAEPVGGSQTTPAMLYMAMARSLASEAGPDYSIDARGRGANSRHGFELAFSPAGARIVGVDGDLILHLTRFGRGDGDRVRRTMPRIKGAWAEYDRGPGLEEWFVNSPRGIEQGWTVSERPAGVGPLVLEIDTGRELDEIHAGRFARSGLVYHGLVAFDAEGRELPALWRQDGTRLRIEVDDAAAVYPLVVDPWLQQAKLTSADGEEDDLFGSSVALSGDVALVGAPQPPFVGSQGAAYIFTRSGSIWSEQAKLIASDGSERDLFGTAVALEDDTALVGAPHATVGENPEQGAVYVFTRNGSTWSQQAKLIAGDGAAYNSFGGSLALDGDTVLVGATGASGGQGQGASYVFTRSDDIWTQQAKLVAVDEDAVDFFGSAVAVSGDTALVSAPPTDVDDNFSQGAAYVFIRSGGIWTQQARLVADDGAKDDFFGTSVAIAGDTAVVGASFADVNGNTWQGAAYVFTRSGDSWSQQAKLTASGGAAADHFGSSVALADDTALVGSRRSGLGGNSRPGAVFLFARDGDAWSQRDKLVAVDGMGGDSFGESVAYRGDIALVGSPNAHVEGNADQGTAYIFVLWPLAPVNLDVDRQSVGSDGNSVFEPGETVEMAPAWHNSSDKLAFADGILSDFTGPGGAWYDIDANGVGYVIPIGESSSCQDSESGCYELRIELAGAERPAPHWDATVNEELTIGPTDTLQQTWILHVGDSFIDVPRSHLFYTGIETLLHSGVTGGCGDGTDYCPADANTRSQMPAFMLRALEGPGYTPEACVEGEARMFDDVPASNLFCPWIEDLAGRGIVSGCGGDNYCPSDAVTRAQMAIFLLKTLEGPDYEPTECTNRFTDVPCSSIFADWIEDLAVREITGGCSETEYCPSDAVTRGQMAAFITKTFGFTLYGP